jgi:hypothetical protein
VARKLWLLLAAFGAITGSLFVFKRKKEKPIPFEPCERCKVLLKANGGWIFVRHLEEQPHDLTGKQAVKIAAELFARLAVQRWGKMP